MKSGSKPRLNFFSFEAIGTHWDIECDIFLENPHVKAAIVSRIAEFDQLYSRFRDDSLVSEIASRTGVYDVPDDIKTLLDFYSSLYTITDGAVSPLVGQTLSDAGYDAAYSLRFKRRTVAPPMQTALKIVNNKLHIYKPVLLDFGAAGKGFLVDSICELLQKYGAKRMVINAGGDMRIISSHSRPVAIALEHPDDAARAVGVAEVQSGGLCGSSIRLRKWDDYNHIIDPRTAISPNHILSVWVYAQTAMQADGLTTALFFTDPDVLRQSYQFEYAILYQDYSLEYSKDFPGKFFDETDRNAA